MHLTQGGAKMAFALTILFLVGAVILLSGGIIVVTTTTTNVENAIRSMRIARVLMIIGMVVILVATLIVLLL